MCNWPFIRYRRRMLGRPNLCLRSVREYINQPYWIDDSILISSTMEQITDSHPAPYYSKSHLEPVLFWYGCRQFRSYYEQCGQTMPPVQGSIVKSINQRYNKQIARIISDSKVKLLWHRKSICYAWSEIIKLAIWCTKRLKVLCGSVSGRQQYWYPCHW